MSYSVSQLAQLAGVTARTLHHYDQIGLLSPARVNSNGYREYGHTELLRLQQILFFRELDFSLEHIKKILDHPRFDMLEALADQRRLLRLKTKRLEELIATITKTIKKMKGTENMSDNDLYGGFSQKQIDNYQAEAQAKWGHTDAWKQSQQRVKGWTKADWQKISQQTDAINKALVANMAKGIASPEVQAQIAHHRQLINNFYDCTLEIYRGLATMYIGDQRFTDFYRKYHQDLPEFLSKAMLYYCDH